MPTTADLTQDTGRSDDTVSGLSSVGPPGQTGVASAMLSASRRPTVTVSAGRSHG